jgi:selenophosphate synthase
VAAVSEALGRASVVADTDRSELIKQWSQFYVRLDPLPESCIKTNEAVAHRVKIRVSSSRLLLRGTTAAGWRD